MSEFLSSLPLFALVLTIGTFQIGLFIQKKAKTPLCNPVLISAVLVIAVVLLTKYPVAQYQAGTKALTWVLTPATVCLALPLYEQMKTLKKNMPAILAGITAGTFTSLLVVAGMCHLLSLNHSISVSLLPKSITTAMGIVLSANVGGIEALTTAVIIVTGILGALSGSILCKVFHITHPIAQGVAFGTASHVVGTSRANELGDLTGAVSSLSLTFAGILTAVVFPLACLLLPK